MRRGFLLLISVGTLLVLAASPALAAPGNNGTVKIDGVEFDQHPNNEPHVGCIFQVDFYGYDEGDLEATATFALHPPTGTAVLLTQSTNIGEDPAGGGTDLDAEMTVDLTDPLANSGAIPHPIQGYHVKLTVHAEGSIGADTKHKVFWVKCGNYPPVPTEGSTAQVAPISGAERSFAGSGSPMWPAVAGLSIVAVGGALILRRGARKGAAS
jgi:hypothetical protein